MLLAPDMKTILLLRHGKSDWGDPDLEDFERPLTRKGKRDAPRIGRVLLQCNLLPDLIVCSPAQRAKQTARLVARTCGYTEEIIIEDLLYKGRKNDYLEVLRLLSPIVRRPLLVGHNPELEGLIATLLCRGSKIRFPTSALICLQAPVEHWLELKPRSCVLQWLLIPKLLKAVS